MVSQNNIKPVTIVFSGGGTGGSVTPLLAVAKELLVDEPNLKLVFIGTKTGPERELVANFSSAKPLEFITLTSGKLRRYFSFSNFIDLFKIMLAVVQSLIVLSRLKPDLVVSAGSFVSVPLVFAAALKRIPVLIHQQDVRPGLANRLMAPFARVISVTFEKSLIDYGPKAVLVGNPISLPQQLMDKSVVKEKYHLPANLPLVVSLGGGTGSAALNELIFKAREELGAFCSLVQITGAGKRPKEELAIDNYCCLEFISNEELVNLLNTAEIVITRAGLGVLTELAALAKPAIIVPLPNSHQEDNAKLFKNAKAALVFDQKLLTPDKLREALFALLNDQALKEQLSRNIGRLMKPGAADNLVGIIWEMLKIDNKNEKE